MDRGIDAAGFIWYRDENEYNLCISQYSDGKELEPYHEWLENAEKLFQHLIRKGKPIIKVYPYPDFFVWCKARGQDFNAENRNMYASWIATREYLGKKGVTRA